jgi:hypothetical protein
MGRRPAILAGYLREPEMTLELGRCWATLARWRKMGIGPPHTSNGKQFIYNVEHVREWLAAGGTATAKKGGRRK